MRWRTAHSASFDWKRLFGAVAIPSATNFAAISKTFNLFLTKSRRKSINVRTQMRHRSIDSARKSFNPRNLRTGRLMVRATRGLIAQNGVGSARKQSGRGLFIRRRASGPEVFAAAR
ncbi:MAG: hypothetical protein WAK55_01805 [Xanthobacteraceae bacterium]